MIKQNSCKASQLNKKGFLGLIIMRHMKISLGQKKICRSFGIPYWLKVCQSKLTKFRAIGQLLFNGSTYQMNFSAILKIVKLQGFF